MPQKIQASHEACLFNRFIFLSFVEYFLLHLYIPVKMVRGRPKFMTRDDIGKV